MKKYVVIIIFIISNLDNITYSKENKNKLNFDTIQNLEKKSNKKIPNYKNYKYKPFRVDVSPFTNIGVFTSFRRDENYSDGFSVGFIVEPKYSFKTWLSLGLRLEGRYFLVSFYDNITTVPVYDIPAFNKLSISTLNYLHGGGAGFNFQLLPTIDFHAFSRSKVRLYFGLGAGLNISSYGISGLILSEKSRQSSVADKTKELFIYKILDPNPELIIAPRIGFDINHVRLNFVYSIIGGSRNIYNNVEALLGDNSSNKVTLEKVEIGRIFNSFSLQLLVYFGGGRKRISQ